VNYPNLILSGMSRRYLSGLVYLDNFLGVLSTTVKLGQPTKFSRTIKVPPTRAATLCGV